MKKYLLSGATVFSFLIYSLYKNYGGEVRKPADNTSFSPGTSTNVTTPTSGNMSGGMGMGMMGGYKDGVYKGDRVDAYYGFVQVEVSIAGGNIDDVKFLSYPNDRRTSIYINRQAMPLLRQEAIKTQTASVDIVSGATQTSLGFRKSLESALVQAK
jgi:uncharacterized protein with FMN-binding domain